MTLERAIHWIGRVLLGFGACTDRSVLAGGSRDPGEVADGVTVKLLLSRIVGAVLVIEGESGATYWNQTGGVFCTPREVKGFALPIDVPGDDVDMATGGRLADALGKIFFKFFGPGGPTVNHPVRDELLGELNMALDAEFDGMIKVDVGRRMDVDTAWVPVVVSAQSERLGLIEPCVERKGIITWDND